MAQCIATTKSGARCRNEALPGSEYCRVHQHLRALKGEAPEMVVKTGREKVKVRYLGNTSYWVAGYHFTRENRELEVPEKLAEYLVESQPELFEIAE